MGSNNHFPSIFIIGNFNGQILILFATHSRPLRLGSRGCPKLREIRRVLIGKDFIPLLRNIKKITLNRRIGRRTDGREEEQTDGLTDVEYLALKFFRCPKLFFLFKFFLISLSIRHNDF